MLSSVRASLSALPTLLLFVLILTATPSGAEEGQNRLSDWLLSRAQSSEDYPPGLLWRVPAEEVVQAQDRSDLLQSILHSGGDPAAIRLLADWISSMPITGRVPVSIVDADWLRANPLHDPVIQTGHQVILPKRPHTVQIITSDGRRCQLPHVAGGMAIDYLHGCTGGLDRKADWAWVIQADGKVARFGISSWNGQKQDFPAPGAWIWVPYRDDQWANDISWKMANFLATQGVSADPGVSTQENVSGRFALETDNIPSLTLTANDWGGVGLLQSPTARMRTVGYGSMTLSRVYPYSHINFFLQPMDWMELGFRYTSVSNRLYGPRIAGDQAYKDKSTDVKFGLLDESAYLPQIALGMRDITGTGLFSGEYLVANKRTGSFDWSIGVGWGYSGGRGNLNNPLVLIGDTFKNRQSDVGEGGNFSVSSYFRGPVSLFGGVQFQSPWEPLILKLEYDGNDYQHEPQGNNLPQDTPFNFGAVYRLGESVEMALGFERGNTFTLGITLQTDLKKMSTPKLDDPAPLPVASDRPQKSAIGAATVLDLENQSGWTVDSIEQNSNTLNVNISNAEGTYWHEHTDRANAVLHRDASSRIDFFTFVQRQRGTAMVVHKVDRAAWVREQTEPVPPNEQRDSIIVQEIEPTQPAGGTEQSIYRGKTPLLETAPGIGLRYNLGGPDAFILYQIFAEGRARLNLREDTWLQGSLQLGLLDNYDNFDYTAPSNLPRVRTHIREYLTSSAVTMPNLQFAHMGKLSGDQYYSVYGGYLESMFAGVGAEWMYRPMGSPIAIGVDLNRVRQRDFNQDFALRDYQTETGHATLYWDTGWRDVLANLSAGRYLAGDAGVTVELSRVFQNGVRFGGYFTKTNISAAQFGEGSFDKGLYVRIPFDAMLTKSSGQMGNFNWKPLIRDGGAKLGREVQLYELTKLLDRRTLQYRSADPRNHIPVPSRRADNW
jgi:hypothetical protein